VRVRSSFDSRFHKVYNHAVYSLGGSLPDMGGLLFIVYREAGVLHCVQH